MPEGTPVKLPHCLKPAEEFNPDQVIVWFLISLMRFSSVYELVRLVFLSIEYVAPKCTHPSYIGGRLG